MSGKAMKDMTKGSPMKLILGFLIPMLFGLLFQQFYSMMDTVIVGKFLGVNALAAVGATGSINFMVIGFCMGVCNGFAITVAQQFGAGDYHALRKYVANSVWLTARRRKRRKRRSKSTKKTSTISKVSLRINGLKEKSPVSRQSRDGGFFIKRVYVFALIQSRSS